MQTTSDTWKSLVGKAGTKAEYVFDIDGVRYTEDSELSHSVTREMYSEFGIGGTGGATLTLKNCGVDVPAGAEVRRYVRLKKGDTVSEWLPKGVFFVSTREVDGEWKTLTAYDAMRRADAVWEPDDSLEFPLNMTDLVAELASALGVSVDERTELNDDYTAGYPGEEYTVRQMLQFVAAAHGGNFIITDAGELLLVPLISAPEYQEDDLLVTEDGDVIVFGEVCIIV